MKTTEEIINRLSKELEPFGFYPLKISKFPTWVNTIVQNGIEVKPNEINPFSIKEGGKVYTGKFHELTLKAVDEVFYKKGEPMKEEAPQQNEIIEQIPNSNLVEVKKEVVGILPEYFTVELMEKWKLLPGLKRLLDVQHTPEHQVYQVEVGKANGKPVMASYVKANYMITEANYVFLFDWNYEVTEVSISVTGVSVRGVFIGNMDGKIMKKSSVGYQERNKNMDAQQATKAALTDAIKKALSYMGFNRDVYGGEI